ncbi:MAG: aromatic ring-hydroxylating dioxygenase subunit alpha, partial [Chloroflexota bacterium]
MLTKAMNETLTRIGPGTPMGDLMRRYWHPIAGASELDDNPVKKVRVLCEDLVLYRDKAGNLGLIDEPCPHRRVSMEYGIPEQEGLRCPYHGWLFNHEGRCLEQPAEPWNATFKDRVTTKSYPVQELGGLVFAYMGPAPAPLLPRFDLLAWENVVRQVGVTVVPCNWLQCMENSLDPVHVEWLHGYYMDYVWSTRGRLERQFQAKHKRIGFDRFEFGIIKRRVVEGNTSEDDPWKVGHPIIFPTILRIGSSGNYRFDYRVPVDDTHTLHLTYSVYRPGIPLPAQQSVPVYNLPMFDDQGKWMTEVILVQDFFAWASQGAIADRDKEHLGQSDIGIIMFRELLHEQMELVRQGKDPMGVIRDPDQNVCIMVPQEEHSYDARAARQSRQQLRGLAE